MSSAPKTAVVGVGALGGHHARIYHESPDVDLVGVVDSSPDRAAEVARMYGCAALTDYRDLIHLADAVSLAVPTLLHAEIGSALLRAGLHVLVEKPIADTLEGADRLIAAQEASGRVLHVGHSERFNPALTGLQEHLTLPLFFEGHRLGAFVTRSLDVDVVLDLMIHDLDLVLSLVQQPLREIRAAGVPVLTPRIDIANARLEFENGCVANLTASRVSTEKVRKLRFFQPGQYLSLDFQKRETEIFGVVDAGGEKKISHQVVSGEAVEPLRAEISAFLSCVRGHPGEAWPGPCSGPQGRAVLEVALNLLSQMRSPLQHGQAHPG